MPLLTATACAAPTFVGEGLFELFDQRSGGQPGRSQRLDHRRDVVVVNGLTGVWKQLLPHGFTAVDGQVGRIPASRSHLLRGLGVATASSQSVLLSLV